MNRRVSMTPAWVFLACCSMGLLEIRTVEATTFYAVTAAAAPSNGGMVSCTPNTVMAGDISTCTATAQPGFTLDNFSGCNGATGTTSPYTTGSIFAPCTVTATFSAPLSLTMQASATYARYGQVADFNFSVTNIGGVTAQFVAVHGLLSSAFDVVSAQWQCTGAQNGTTCAAASTGQLNDTITVTPGKTLQWVGAATVLQDATEETGHLDVVVTGASPGVLSVDMTLVLFRNSFD
jgi:uncharacterized repeat protein (TIGR01451 family)